MEENKKVKSSLKNNILISFVVIIVLWSVIIVQVIEKNLNYLLIKNNLTENMTQEILRNVTEFITGSAILAIIISIVIAVFLSKDITEPLKRLIDLVKQISQGNLDVMIDYTGEHEISQLAGAFNEMTSNLKKVTISRDALNEEIAIRRKVEEELVHEKNLAQNYLDICGVIILTLDVEGNVTMINKKGCSILEYTQEEIIGKNWFDNFLPGSTGKSLKEEFYNHIKSGSFDHSDEGHESNIITRTGTEKIINWFCSILYDENNTIIGSLSSGHDITLRKKYEEYMLNSRKLESIGLLAGGIAHDFNNILTSIIGNISLLKALIKDDAALLRIISNAEIASERAKDLSSQLLTFSKGGTPIKKTASIVEILTESVNFILKGSNVKCDFFIKNNIFPVDIDIGQINQVINNLIINSDQAMPDGGKITIICENVTIDNENNGTFKPGNYVRISIKDTGIGIPEEDISKIFDPYFTTKTKGNGLGLTTTYSIIKKHEGYINVESQVGVGTSFYVYLPASKNTIENIKKDTGIIKGTGRIIVMDDNAMLRDTMNDMLTHLGYEVKFTTNGTETIDMYKKELENGRPFDLVIMDLIIPGEVGGKETIKELLQIDPKIKAIVSSGYSNDPIMSDYQNYGFSGVLKKPIQINELSNSLIQFLV